MTIRRGLIGALALAALVAAGCSSGGDDDTMPANAQRLTVTVGDALAFESTGEAYLCSCSSRDSPGEMPTTSPPAALAPSTAAYGRPGLAPVMSTQSRSAIVRPSCTSRASLSSGNDPLADPITPTVSFIVPPARFNAYRTTALTGAAPACKNSARQPREQK